MTDFSKIKALFGITNPKGFSVSEMQSVQSIFGQLPQVLVDYYLELGNEKDLNYTQDSLIFPNKFQHFKNEDYFIFYSENQCACVWGIKKEDIHLSNPPVYMSYDEKDWEIESENLYDFLLAMAYLQAVFSLDYRGETFRYITEKDLEFIRENYENKKVTFKQWTQGIEFYSNYDDSIIVIMGGCEQMIYSSRNKEHFIEMDKILSTLGETM